MALISRDAFARTELHRVNCYVPKSDTGCSWCGQLRQTKRGYTYLYAYRTESDGGRKHQLAGFFCSKSCLDAYI